MDKFWMVMRLAPNGGAEQPTHLRPAIKHFKAAEAFDEAKRLAVKHPGDSFAIMVALKTVRLPFEIKDTAIAPDNKGCEANGSDEPMRGRFVEPVGF